MESYSDNFDRSFIESLPAEPIEALYDLLDHWKSVQRSKSPADPQPVLRDYVRLYSIVRSLAHDAGIPVDDIDGHDSDEINIKDFMSYLRGIFVETAGHCETALVQREINRTDELTEEFQEIRAHVELVEFSESEFEQIQTLTNELRDLIVDTSDLEDNHKSRILNRLEDFQRELHKKMSNLDRFWVFFGEAGVRLGEFGENVKPFTDRLRELAQIVLKAVDFQEALTGDLGKLLPPPGDDK